MKKEPLIKSHGPKKNFAPQIIITINMIYFWERGTNFMPAQNSIVLLRPWQCVGVVE